MNANDQSSTSTTARPSTPKKRLFAASAVAVGVALALQLTPPGGMVNAASAPEAAASTMAQAQPGSFASVVEQVKPAVVNVSASMGDKPQARMPNLQVPEGSPLEKHFREFFGENMPRTPRGTPGVPGVGVGSGFIVDASGIVVTNNHVVDTTGEITVTLQDGRRLPAEVIGRDAKTDLAVLKVDAGEPLPFVEFSADDGARVGDWVIAVGNPFGLGGTVTAGIISARGRDIQSGPYDDYLQIDAPINRGNSGGPLFDRAGRVIGVNTAIFSPSGGNVGIGFAIPAGQAGEVIAQLRANGHIDRGWMGVQIQSVTEELAESLGMDEARGALIAGVMPDGPARSAGFRTGDVILGFDGKAIDDVKDLTRQVARTKADAKVAVDVWREGKKLNMDLTVGAMQQEQQVALAGKGEADDSTPKLGVMLSALTPETRSQLGVPADTRGVLVRWVEPGSPAAKRGIRTGDIIVRVGLHEVDEPREVASEIKKLAEAEHRSVLLLVHRDGNQQFVTVPLSKA